MGKAKDKPHYVYRYIDETDGVIKYVGIAGKYIGAHMGDGLAHRIASHKSQDEWRDKGVWRIECFECENKSTAEAFESHLISLYRTDNYYNKYKAKWGLNKYLPNIEDKWQLVETPYFADVETIKVVRLCHMFIRSIKSAKSEEEANIFREAVREILGCIEYVGEEGAV